MCNIPQLTEFSSLPPWCRASTRSPSGIDGHGGNDLDNDLQLDDSDFNHAFNHGGNDLDLNGSDFNHDDSDDPDVQVGLRADKASLDCLLLN